MAKTIVDYLREDVVRLDNKMETRFKEISDKLEDLNSWKWKTIGTNSVITSVVVLIVEFLISKYNHS